MRVLLTTTSFQDTPGSHHDLLKETGYEIVRARGPLKERELLNLVSDIDGIICGDDHITRKVMEKALPRLKVISKYGVGLDKIDLKAATDLKIPVTNTVGVNEVTVAEHTIGLMISLAKNIPFEVSCVKQGEWKRVTGHELWNKTIGIVGLGRIGKQVAKRVAAFEMKIIAYDPCFPEEFAEKYGIIRCSTLIELAEKADIITLHAPLTEKTRGIFNKEIFAVLKPTCFLINCARGELVDKSELIEALKRGKLKGYAADVMDKEPPVMPDELISLPNVIVTPHIGSRTYESVVRQATMAIKNLVAVFNEEKLVNQVNKF